VVEREGIDNLLRERQIIRETRAIYEGAGDLSRSYLPPLLFAGMLLEGGIVGYDSNTLTGGLGARLLGIGGNTEFRQDTVTIYLRAISTQSGEVLESVNVSKTVFSVALSANVFRFIESDEILEIDAGITTNEPEHIAIKMAVDKAVVALVLNGARRERWAFADPAAAVALLGTAPPAETTAEADPSESTPAPTGGAAPASATSRAPAAAAPIRVAARAPEQARPQARGGSAEAEAGQALASLIAAEAAAQPPPAAATPAAASPNETARRARGDHAVGGPDRALLVEIGVRGR
jgi:curli production assembly/transport component CsgG